MAQPAKRLGTSTIRGTPTARPHTDARRDRLASDRQRPQEARFPGVKTLDTFDFTAAADGVNATQIHTLAHGEWVAAPEN